MVISGLNTRPARTPTNASQPALRLATHSSGPTWFAIPLSYDSCIRYTSPLIPALPPLPPIARGAHLFCLRDRRGNSVTSAPRLVCLLRGTAELGGAGGIRVWGSSVSVYGHT